MRKILLVVFLLAAAVATAAIFVRRQPPGTATVFRAGSHVTMRRTRVYLRPLGALPCSVPISGERLAFASELPAVSATGDEFTVRTRFSYAAPASLPAEWPDGDWCHALQSMVTTAVRRAASSTNVGELLDQRRQIGERIADEVRGELRSRGLPVDPVSARVDLPSGFERLRVVPAVARSAKPSPPVIFIGLDGADWHLLDRTMAAGLMPNLQRLVAGGISGPLETEFPPLSPLVWTTMMTGTGPLQHQILDFSQFDPVTHAKEPITSSERRVPAIWNMLTDAGKQTAMFGMWATYAAEPVHGINVSDRLFSFFYATASLPRGVVYPPQREEWARDTVARVERQIDLARMRQYLPTLTEAEFAALEKAQNPYANPAAALRRILVQTEVYRQLSLDALSNRTELPDLTIVYFEGTDTIGHEFAPFAAPKLPQVSQADFDRYHEVPDKYFHYIDTILRDYFLIAQLHHAVIVIASDHGFHWTEGRPTQISSTATATAAKWHAKEGIFLVWNAPGLPKPSGIRQVCAVLLGLTGLPDADYGRDFRRAAPPPASAAPAAAQEDLAKLRALGYIGTGESSRSAAPEEGTKTAGAWNNEGLILRNQHQIDQAIAAFQHALNVDPRDASAMWNLSETLLDARRDLDLADTLLVTALQNGLPDAPRLIIERSIAYQTSGHGGRNLGLLGSAVDASPRNAELRMFRGRYRMDRNDCTGALQDFLAAGRERPNDALAWASAGLAQACLGDDAAARASFAHAHALDPTLKTPM